MWLTQCEVIFCFFLQMQISDSMCNGLKSEVIPQTDNRHDVYRGHKTEYASRAFTFSTCVIFIRSTLFFDVYEVDKQVNV